MNTIHDLRLGGLDLNLLLVLDALLDTRSATRAAERLGSTQSAVSHALARLRRELGDPLLVKRGRGLVPTPRAEALHQPVRLALEALASALAPATFDPLQQRRTFMIGTPDYGAVLIGPRLVDRVLREAPGVTLVFAQLTGEPTASLSDGTLDLVFGTSGPESEGLFQQRLWDDGFSCLLRADHPRVSEPWDLDLFCALRHVLIAPRGTPGSVVDSALEELGRARVVMTRVAHFVAAAHVAAGSDAMVTLPTRLADLLAPTLGLVVRPPPIPLPRFTLWQQWHARQHADPAHRWLRHVIADAAAG